MTRLALRLLLQDYRIRLIRRCQDFCQCLAYIKPLLVSLRSPLSPLLIPPSTRHAQTMPDTVPAPTDDRLKEQIKNIRACIRHGPPYCQGTVAVPAHDLTLFYGTEGNAQYVSIPVLVGTLSQ